MAVAALEDKKIDIQAILKSHLSEIHFSQTKTSAVQSGDINITVVLQMNQDEMKQRLSRLKDSL